jgi:hypothetical protein
MVRDVVMSIISLSAGNKSLAVFCDGSSWLTATDRDQISCCIFAARPSSCSTLSCYNAHGDIAVANSIAKEMVNAHFDLLPTASTLSLQAVANANRDPKTVQVFGAVADPGVAGVGIRHDKPLDHPRNLMGIGSFLPVAEAFRIAREMFPGLKTGGKRNVRRHTFSGRRKRSQAEWDRATGRISTVST